MVIGAESESIKHFVSLPFWATTIFCLTTIITDSTSYPNPRAESENNQKCLHRVKEFYNEQNFSPISTTAENRKKIARH